MSEQNQNQNQASYGGTLMVFLLGVAVGATAAILFAPMSGSETRAQLADKATALKDKAEDLRHQVSDKASQWKDAAATKLHKITDNGITSPTIGDGASAGTEVEVGSA